MNPLEQICQEQNIKLTELMDLLAKEGRKVLAPEYWQQYPTTAQEISIDASPAQPISAEPYAVVQPVTADISTQAGDYLSTAITAYPSTKPVVREKAQAQESASPAQPLDLPKDLEIRAQTLVDLEIMGSLGATRVLQHNLQALKNGSFEPYYSSLYRTNGMLKDIFGAKIPRKYTAREDQRYYTLKGARAVEQEVSTLWTNKKEALALLELNVPLESVVTHEELWNRHNTLACLCDSDLSSLLQQNPQIVEWTFKFEEYVANLQEVYTIIKKEALHKYRKDQRLAHPKKLKSLEQEIQTHLALKNIEGQDRSYLLEQNPAMLQPAFNLKGYVAELRQVQRKIHEAGLQQHYASDPRFADRAMFSIITKEIENYQQEQTKKADKNERERQQTERQDETARNDEATLKLEQKIARTKQEFGNIGRSIEEFGYDFCMVHAIVSSLHIPGGGNTFLGRKRATEKDLYKDEVKNWYCGVGYLDGTKVKSLYERTMHMLKRDGVVFQRKDDHKGNELFFSLCTDAEQVPAYFLPYLRKITSRS